MNRCNFFKFAKFAIELFSAVKLRLMTRCLVIELQYLSLQHQVSSVMPYEIKTKINCNMQP